METIASWVATVATIGAALMTASNLGTRITGYGFAVFTVGSIAWLALGLLSGQPALVYTNVVMTGINLFGVWRWLGRQAAIEQGAQSAVEASERSPGEALFPVSILSRAQVCCADGTQIGTCVDAMAGCRSGHIDYVVVGEGGLAGVGELLRRLPWEKASIDRDRLSVSLDETAFRRLPPIEKDQWPAH